MTPRTRTISVQCRALPHMPHTWVRWLAWKKPCWSHPCTSRTCLDCTENRRSIQSLAPSSPYPPTTTKLKNLSFISDTSVDFLIERHFSAKSCNRLSIWNLQPSSCYDARLLISSLPVSSSCPPHLSFGPSYVFVTLTKSDILGWQVEAQKFFLQLS